MAADSIGVTPTDTGEFLIGTVAVTPVFFESNGEIDPETQDWSAGEIDQVLAKLSEGVNWWSDTLDALDTVHTLDFVIDDTYARNPFETGYEPIDRVSTDFERYVSEFLTSIGYGDAVSIEDGVRRLNNAQRLAHSTDWAFTIFVVDSSDDDGFFPVSNGSFPAAFAFAGGLFYVAPSTRPASTFAHEMGHIFWARDEYSGGGSWTDRRGYYNAQNLNAENNPTQQSEISIMRGGAALADAYAGNTSPASTLALIGWRDSDGDGVFDLADVPLHFDAIGHFDPNTSLYHLSGDAAAVPLINQNSAGPQSDITLNEVSRLEYRLDQGPWMVAADVGQQVAEFDVEVTIDQPFNTIQWRVIDAATGVTSATVQGTATIPAIPATSVSGLAFLDDNADGQRATNESPLPLTEVTVRNADGSPLFGGDVDAGDFPNGALLHNLSGVSVSADGVLFDDEVRSFVSTQAGNQRVFHARDQLADRWIERWSSKVAFEAVFDQSVGEVQLDAIGLADGSYGRLEAYDAAGKMLARHTSDSIALGETVTLGVSDPLGRIARIRALGHNDTSVALNDLRFGFEPAALSGDGGAWKVGNLPDGNYLVDLVPEKVIHQFSQAPFQIEVAAGTSQLIVAAAERVNSPRHNEVLPEDANNVDGVTSLDALVIINDLSRFGARMLQHSETTGFDVDVSNDGIVSALDALLVINFLGRQGSGGAAEGEPAVSGPSAATAGRSAAMLTSGSQGADEGESQEDVVSPNMAGQRRWADPRPQAGQNGGSSPLSAPSAAPSEPGEAENPEQPDESIRSGISEPFGHLSI